MQKLFIYGTLAPGRPNEHKLSDIEGSWQKAFVKGRLEEKGWGASMGYPGIILDNKANEIEGFLFQSNELDKKYKLLDEFEGSEYKRVEVEVRLEDNSFTKAFIYALSEN